MNKDKLQEKIEQKAKRSLDVKLNDLNNYINRYFPEKASEIRKRMDIKENTSPFSRGEDDSLYKTLLGHEIDRQEIEFFNKIETIFYNLEN